MNYWTTKNEDYDIRLQRVSGYEYMVWRHLQRYAIATENKRKQTLPYIDVLATAISVEKIAEDLSISCKRVKKSLKLLDDKNFIIKRPNENIDSKDVYILGIYVYDEEEYKYFIDFIINEGFRASIIKIFDVYLAEDGSNQFAFE